MSAAIHATPRGVRLRQRGQALVEFGLVILLFVLVVAGMFEFGLLLNLRASVSALSRELARSASLGDDWSKLSLQANLPGARLLDVTTATFTGYCCGPTDAVVVTLTYYTANCPSGCTDKTLAAPKPGDRVEVAVTAMGADVVTPIVRPAFVCNGPAPHCFQHISASTTMRYEGP